jgi:EAL domain-containing protein (putative c-di-GMP-specific phosphodiesterase class I)
VRVAVNVSAVQFERADFVESVLATVRDSGLNPRLLELELTESTLVRDRDEGAKKMEELRAFGIRIAIDDFGTGYSSLSYLQNMPVDTLKVDRAFTARLSTSATAVTMVRAIIAMARALGLRIVTEGVETEEQAEILRQLGSDEVQGYLYGYPESAQSAAERVWRELVPAAILTSQGRSLALLAGVGKQSRESVTGVIMPHSVQ